MNIKQNNYDLFLKKLLKNVKNSDLLIKLLLSLKFPLSYLEVKKLIKIVDKQPKSKIKQFFKIISQIEIQNYEDFKYVDYFFLLHISDKISFKKNLEILSEINENFYYFANKIFQNNLKKLQWYKKTHNQKNFVLIGGLATFNYKLILKEIKDIDIIDLNMLGTNLKVKIFKINCSKILVEYFSIKDYFFNHLLSEPIADIIITMDGITTITKKGLELNYNKKIFIPTRKNLLVLKALNSKYIVSELKTYPPSNHINDFFIYFLKNNYYKEQFNYYKLLNFNLNSSSILVINRFLTNFNFSEEIYFIFYKKILLNSKQRSYLNIFERPVALLFFMNVYKDKLNYHNFTLEERISLFSNLEKIISDLLKEYLINYSKYRNNLNVSFKD